MPWGLRIRGEGSSSCTESAIFASELFLDPPASFNRFFVLNLDLTEWAELDSLKSSSLSEPNSGR